MATGAPPWKNLGFTSPHDLFRYVHDAPLAMPALPASCSAPLANLLEVRNDVSHTGLVP